ncbi:hypothetical protein BgiBS90_032658 [Biomphalaria glabrata]|nr:hypothetical protein BgiBS90_032658 [Biomphalaria glabrata]
MCFTILDSLSVCLGYILRGLFDPCLGVSVLALHCEFWYYSEHCYLHRWRSFFLVERSWNYPERCYRKLN